MKKRTSTVIASVSDRENLVAELLCEEEQWAELNQEGPTLEVELYPRSDSEPWRFDFDELVEALFRARSLLLGEPGERK